MRFTHDASIFPLLDEEKEGAKKGNAPNFL